MATPQVRSLTVEANEFPRLSREFMVSGVPRTVVNRTGAFVGALPEEQFVTTTLQLAGVAFDEEPEPAPGTGEWEPL